MLIKQISIFVENTKGRMADIVKVIGDADVDIRALSVADTTDFGILRLIVNKPEEAVKALRDAGIMVSLTDVVAVGVDDAPGAFAGVLRTITDANLNVEYVYAFITREKDKAYIIMRFEDPASAVEILKEKNVHLLESAVVYNM